MPYLSSQSSFFERRGRRRGRLARAEALNPFGELNAFSAGCRPAAYRPPHSVSSPYACWGKSGWKKLCWGEWERLLKRLRKGSWPRLVMTEPTQNQILLAFVLPLFLEVAEHSSRIRGQKNQDMSHLIFCRGLSGFLSAPPGQVEWWKVSEWRLSPTG